MQTFRLFFCLYVSHSLFAYGSRYLRIRLSSLQKKNYISISIPVDIGDERESGGKGEWEKICPSVSKYDITLISMLLYLLASLFFCVCIYLKCGKTILYVILRCLIGTTFTRNGLRMRTVIETDN